MNYDGKTFRPIQTTKNSETSEETVFEYHQSGNVITSDYKGGNIKKGHLIGIVNETGCIDMRYHQVNTKGELMTGICQSKPEILRNGQILLYESWEWTSGDKSKGNSILEEIITK